MSTTAFISYDQGGRPLQWYLYPTDEYLAAITAMEIQRYVVQDDVICPTDWSLVPTIESLNAQFEVILNISEVGGEQVGSIANIPEGASLKIDGTDMSDQIDYSGGTGTVIFETADSGTFTITLQKEGYDDWSYEVTAA